jgi:hypothetical protein
MASALRPSSFGRARPGEYRATPKSPALVNSRRGIVSTIVGASGQGLMRLLLRAQEREPERALFRAPLRRLERGPLRMQERELMRDEERRPVRTEDSSQVRVLERLKERELEQWPLKGPERWKVRAPERTLERGEDRLPLHALEPDLLNARRRALLRGRALPL